MAPQGLASHLNGLANVRKITDPDERNNAIGLVASDLIDRYLRHGRGVPSERLRVLDILSKLADRAPGCFGYGEPGRTVPLLLALLPLLPEPVAEWQHSVLTLLRTMLGLLHLSDARCCAAALHDALDLLSRLPSPHASSPPAQVHGFAGLAGSVTHQGPGDTVVLELGCPSRVAWLEGGLLRLCADVHSSSPQLLGSGSAPLLWTALLRRLDHELSAAGTPASDACRPVAVRALGALLRTTKPPVALCTLLLHRLLTLLCLRADHAPHRPADEAAGHAGHAGYAGRAARSEPEDDDQLGDCLSALTPLLLPPYPALRLLLRATPWALCNSKSAGLQHALSGLLCVLPAQARALPPALPPSPTRHPTLAAPAQPQHISSISPAYPQHSLSTSPAQPQHIPSTASAHRGGPPPFTRRSSGSSTHWCICSGYEAHARYYTRASSARCTPRRKATPHRAHTPSWLQTSRRAPKLP